MDTWAEVGVNMLIRSVGLLVVCVWMGVSAVQANEPGSGHSMPIEQVERDITDVSSRGE